MSPPENAHVIHSVPTSGFGLGIPVIVNNGVNVAPEMELTRIPQVPVCTFPPRLPLPVFAPLNAKARREKFDPAGVVKVCPGGPALSENAWLLKFRRE